LKGSGFIICIVKPNKHNLLKCSLAKGFEIKKEKSRGNKEVTIMNDHPHSVPSISGDKGSWFPGKKPEQVKPGSYPILFIHGINATSETWWKGNNDISELAYSGGYETAFIELSGTDDMWANGLLLAEKLREVYNFFNKKVVIAAHSKGGVDAQTAIVHHGAAEFVKRVITLSTPHHGSELADLAYSKWADWLTETLGSKSDAVFSLQKAYMEAYRKRTDQHTVSREIPFYTFGGTGWGGLNSELFWSGLYLRRFGANDGAVTVKSSRLPYSREVRVDDWNHKTIKQGEEIFPYVESLLGEEVGDIPESADQDSPKEEVHTSVLHRGGAYEGRGTEQFSVEEGVDEMTVDWFSCFRDTELVLTDPGGKIYTDFAAAGDETGFFPNAFHHSTLIRTPDSGKWVLESRNDKRETYLLNVLFTNGVLPQVEEIFSGYEDSKSKGVKMNNVTSINRHVHITHFPVRNSGNKKSIQNPSSLDPVSLSQYDEGILNFTIDIKGITGRGNEFERTVIKTIFVGQDGTLYE
jgi:pimeloyl-ACP methyl ester carboxylesterase